MSRPRVLAALLLAALAATTAPAADFDYHLQPQKIARDTWLLRGADADFSMQNGGNIVNTAFIVTPAGVVVIDSGPSRRYGEQLRAAIARRTAQPVVKVLLTHHHPDHFLGNQAFAPDTVCALPGTIEDIRAEGEDFNTNLYRLTGDWMLGTEVVTPGCTLEPGVLAIGGHHLQLIALDGHTGHDLAVLDQDTGVLFAGDLVFHDRAPTTPHADLSHWLAALDRLAALPHRLLVPGHGAPADDDGPILQTRRWLAWLQATMSAGAEQGMDLSEMLERPLPAEFRRLAVGRDEYRRSLGRLYPAAERAALEHRP